jgi:hypothetical protein
MLQANTFSKVARVNILDSHQHLELISFSFICLFLANDVCACMKSMDFLNYDLVSEVPLPQLFGILSTFFVHCFN